jgi:L-serine dehydratase
MINHSILNDVLGPIMSGPSSSHSAGCARIGLMTRLLFGREIQKANVIFDETGAYPETYIGQGSNFGFTGGLMGFPTDEPKVKDAVEIAALMGKEIWFSKASLSSRHPNEALINVYNENDVVELSVLTFSTGGGMFEIVEMDGFPVYIDGSQKQMFVYCEEQLADKVKESFDTQKAKIKSTILKGLALFTISEYCESREDGIWALNEIEGVKWVRKAPVILPIEMKANPNSVFSTAMEALVYTKKENKSAWEMAIDYECSIGEVSREDVWRVAVQTFEIMKKSTIPPDPETTPLFGFLPYKAKEMQENIKAARAVPTGILNDAAMAAIAVMENSCAHNIVVAAPTAGSSGVLPSSIISIGEGMGLAQDEIIKGLLVAGLVGSFIANQATFGAEVSACQAENGAASCMAAAGVIQLLGGTVDQAFQAASMAMQNMLGLICDPVGGLTEIPCISRNVSALTNAVLSANMVIWGFNPIIPLDESIETMLRVGKQLPDSLRCTCKGGLCVTKTGICIAKKLVENRPIMA